MHINNRLARSGGIRLFMAVTNGHMPFHPAWPPPQIANGCLHMQVDWRYPAGMSTWGGRNAGKWRDVEKRETDRNVN